MMKKMLSILCSINGCKQISSVLLAFCLSIIISGCGSVFKDEKTDKNPVSTNANNIESTANSEMPKSEMTLDSLMQKLAEYKPEDAKTNEEKIAILKKMLDEIDRFDKSAFSEGDKEEIREKRSKIESDKKDIEREIKYEKERADLRTTIENNNVSAQGKLDGIRIFLNAYGEKDKHRETDRQFFQFLQKKETSLELRGRWDRKKMEIDEFVDRRPDSQKRSALKNKLKTVEDLLRTLNGFYTHELKDEVHQVERKLQDEKERIEKYLFDHPAKTLQDVQDVEEKYKNDPTDENYKSLTDVIKQFREGDPDEIDRDNATVSLIEANSREFHQTKEKYKAFLAAPSHDTWNKFKTSLKFDGLQGKYVSPVGYPQAYADICNTLSNYIDNSACMYGVELWSWDFRDTKFYLRGDVDCHVYLDRKAEAVDGDLYCNDMSGRVGGVWVKSDPSYAQDTGRCLKVKRKFSNSLAVQFANLDGWNVFSETHYITIYELLVRGRENGEYTWRIPIPLRNAPNDASSGGYIELKFTDLPIWGKEE